MGGLLFISGAVLIGLLIPSTGRSADTNETVQLQEVVVTATRTKEESHKVPAYVSLLKSDWLEARLPSTLDDAVQGVPSVEMAGGPRSVVENVYIRGLGENRVLMRLDGARQNFITGHKGRVFIDPEMLKQIEIVRGPNSALYGSGAIGGVFDMTTKDASDLLRPGRQWGARTRTWWESGNDQWTEHVDIYGEPVNGWEVLGSFTYRKSDDIRVGNLDYTPRIDPTAPPIFIGDEVPYSRDNIRSGLAKTSYRFLDHHKISFSSLFYRNQNIVPFQADELGQNYTAIADRDTLQDNYSLSYQFDDPNNNWFNFKSTLYYNMTEVNEREITGPSPFTGLRPPDRQNERELDTLGFEAVNQTRFEIADPFVMTWTYGIDGYQDEQTGRENGQPLLSYPDATASVWGAFFQSEFRFFDRFALTPAIRYDNYRLESAFASAANEEEALSPKITLSYEPTDWLTLYVSAAEAFRAPSLSEVYLSGLHFSGNIFVPNPNLKPETAQNIEAGFNIQKENLFLEGDRLQGRFAAYENTVDNFIETIVDYSTFPGTTYQVNLATARIQGIEGELFYYSGTWFGGAGFSCIRGTDETRGEPLRSIPADKISLTIGTEIPAARMSLSWRTDLVARQGRLPLPYDQPIADGYDVHNFYASWRPQIGSYDGARLDFIVENIMDLRYREHLSSIPEMGRNFKIGLTLEF